MKYWLFDVAGLSKLNVVSDTNPPFGNILNLILVVVVEPEAIHCDSWYHTQELVYIFSTSHTPVVEADNIDSFKAQLSRATPM
jgi:hypothetical protein